MLLLWQVLQILPVHVQDLDFVKRQTGEEQQEAVVSYSQCSFNGVVNLTDKGIIQKDAVTGVKNLKIIQLRLLPKPFATIYVSSIVHLQQKNDQMNLSELYQKALDFQFLSVEEGVFLFENAPLTELMFTANELRKKQVPHGKVTWQIDRNVNTTNVCIANCKFCNFYRIPGHLESYITSIDQYKQKMGMVQPEAQPQAQAAPPERQKIAE